MEINKFDWFSVNSKCMDIRDLLVIDNIISYEKLMEILIRIYIR